MDTSGLIIWCNSLALKLGGLTAQSANIGGDVMERTASAAPNGILAEAAGAPVRGIYERSLLPRRRNLPAILMDMAAAFKEPMAHETEQCAYQEADEQGALRLQMAAHFVDKARCPWRPPPIRR